MGVLCENERSDTRDAGTRFATVTTRLKSLSHLEYEYKVDSPLSTLFFVPVLMEDSVLCCSPHGRTTSNATTPYDNHSS